MVVACGGRLQADGLHDPVGIETNMLERLRDLLALSPQRRTEAALRLRCQPPVNQGASTVTPRQAQNRRTWCGKLSTSIGFSR